MKGFRQRSQGSLNDHRLELAMNNRPIALSIRERRENSSYSFLTMARITEPTAEAGAAIVPRCETAAVRHSCYYNSALSYDNTDVGDLQEEPG